MPIELTFPENEEELERTLQEMRSQGATDEDLDFLIDEFDKTAEPTAEDFEPTPVPEGEVTPEEQKEADKPGFIESIKDIGKERAGISLESVRASEAGEQTRAEGFLQVGGQAVAATAESLFEGVKALTPDFIEEKLVEGGRFVLKQPGILTDIRTGEEIGTTNEAVVQAIQLGVDGLKEIEKNNPRLARNLGALFNLSELIPGKKVASVAGDVAEETVEATAKAASKKASKLEADIVESSFKEAEDIAVKRFNDLTKSEKRGRSEDIIKTGVVKKDLVRTPNEDAAIREIKNLVDEKKIKRGDTAIKQRDVVNSEIENFATTLVSKLKNSEVKIPKTEVDELFTSIKQELIESPSLVGNAEAMADKLSEQFLKLAKKDVMTPAELLQLRKDIDATAKKFKPKTFEATSQNAFTETLTAYRRGINNLLEQKVPEADVKNLLRKQSDLYTAQKNILDNVANEAASIAARALKGFENITGLPRTEMIETVVLLGSVGAGALAPSAGAIGGTLFTAKAAKEALTSRPVKAAIAKTLRSFDEAIDVAKGVERQSLKDARSAFLQLMTIEGLRDLSESE